MRDLIEVTLLEKQGPPPSNFPLLDEITSFLTELVVSHVAVAQLKQGISEPEANLKCINYPQRLALEVIYLFTFGKGID